MWETLIRKYERNETYKELNQSSNKRLINEELKNIEVKNYGRSSTYSNIRINSSTFDIHA